MQLGELSSLWIRVWSQLSVTSGEALGYMCWKYSQDAFAAPQQLKLEGWGEGWNLHE